MGRKGVKSFESPSRGPEQPAKRHHEAIEAVHPGLFHDGGIGGGSGKERMSNTNKKGLSRVTAIMTLANGR
jgi:hypothetical protein